MSKSKYLRSLLFLTSKLKLVLLLTPLLLSFVAQSKNVLIASGHGEYPPFMYREGNQIVGVGVDITRLIFAELGIEVKSVYAGAWNRVQRKARAGDIDLIVGIYKTQQRLEYLHYPEEPYLAEPIGLFIHKNQEITFDHWQDLVGKTGATVMGESFGQEFDDFARNNLNIQRLSAIVQSFKMIDRQRIDYSIYALYPGLIKLNDAQGNLQVIAHPNPVATQNAYQAISKKSEFAKHIPYFNQRLKELKKQNIVQQLINQHMNKIKARNKQNNKVTNIKKKSSTSHSER